MKGKNTQSLRKSRQTNNRNPVVGVKSVKFHHESIGGETLIDLMNLTTPAGFGNPTIMEMATFNLQLFANDLILMSSARPGPLMEKVSYTITTNKTITLHFSTLEGEIITGVFLNRAVNGVLVADGRTIADSNTLTEALFDMNLGDVIEISDVTNQWPMQMFRGPGGTPMIRNTNNGTTGGNYQMLDRGDGFCQVVRFNIAGGVGGEQIMWAHHGAVIERPAQSMLQQLDGVTGVISQMKLDLLAIGGWDILDPTRYDAMPTKSDLLAFGDSVQLLNKNLGLILDQTFFFDENTFSAHVSTTGVVTSESIDFIEGNAVITDASVFTLTFKAGFFTDTPSVIAMPRHDSGNRAATCAIEGTLSASSVAIRTGYTYGSSTYTKNPMGGFHVIVQRQGADYKAPVTLRSKLGL